mmetsp:Transcript_42394/g.48723  ORF Transcript_42394/g.48723 Transcript_42394/m.48723 type:complete len:284 (-) Transcript_42394:103-954(-)
MNKISKAVSYVLKAIQDLKWTSVGSHLSYMFWCSLSFCYLFHVCDDAHCVFIDEESKYIPSTWIGIVSFIAHSLTIFCACDSFADRLWKTLGWVLAFSHMIHRMFWISTTYDSVFHQWHYYVTFGQNIFHVLMLVALAGRFFRDENGKAKGIHFGLQGTRIFFTSIMLTFTHGLWCKTSSGYLLFSEILLLLTIFIGVLVEVAFDLGDDGSTGWTISLATTIGSILVCSITVVIAAATHDDIGTIFLVFGIGLLILSASVLAGLLCSAGGKIIYEAVAGGAKV